ncbi:hypothetical protein [Chryseobacterium daecheongense]|uniref:Uncharacterized protein n=1 Tax=Chryseobacterium daecheongense TaxID=192389 RepID=A0ABY2FU30_9FLAO|nr:hypothetical protein [Chryseobacterium daecheongense]TDX91955.1 hypothetical protein BCF50_3097 [Chryseobacterium daecheongense]
MKRIFTFLLLFFISSIYSQKKINWEDIFLGDFTSLVKNNVKTLTLKKRGNVVRTVEVEPEKYQIVVKDSVKSNYFIFDTNNHLTSLKVQTTHDLNDFVVKYNDDKVQWISNRIEDRESIHYQRISYPEVLNPKYKEVDKFILNKKNNDSADVLRIKYFFNEKDQHLGYEEMYKSNYWRRKYFNNVETIKQKFSDHFVVDSILYVDKKKQTYHFENYKDEQKIVIEKDSIYTINKKFGKKINEKVEYQSLIFKEFFYNKDGEIVSKIDYIYYKNDFGNLILWEIKNTDNNRIIDRKFPNKKFYKLKKGVLYSKLKTSTITNTNCSLTCSVRYIKMYYASFFSPSILFNLKIEKSFNDYFDASILADNDPELLYNQLDFRYTGSKVHFETNKDIISELGRTTKYITKTKERFLNYFKDMNVELETSDGKKSILNLSENPELLSLSIYTFIIQDY